MKTLRKLPASSLTAVLFVVYALPVYWLLSTSFKPTQAAGEHPAALAFHPSWTAYREAFHEGIGHAFASTVIIAGGTVTVCLAVGLPAAYGLSKSRNLAVPVALGVLVILQMVPQTSTVIPLYRVLGKWGLLGGYAGLIVADSALLLPFTIVLLRPWFHAIPHDIEEAAWVDGANRLTTFMRIMLPVVRNGTATVATLLFITASGEFLYAISFLSDPREYPLTALLSQQVAQYGIDWPGLMAVSVLASVPSIVIFFAGHRALVRGITAGSY